VICAIVLVIADFAKYLSDTFELAWHVGVSNATAIAPFVSCQAYFVLLVVGYRLSTKVPASDTTTRRTRPTRSVEFERGVTLLFWIVYVCVRPHQIISHKKSKPFLSPFLYPHCPA
jgi:hypothetical protein